MRLNMLIVEGDKQHEKTNDVVPISYQVHHIVEIFMHFLPKIDLDGSSKLVIYFMKKPITESTYECDKDFGVSSYYISENELCKLSMLDKVNRDSYYLEIIVDALKTIAQINSCDKRIIEIIEETANKVSSSGFELKQTIKKLSKISQDKQFKAKVYRILNSQGELWYVEIEDKDGNLKKYDIMEKYSHISKEDFYKKSEWRDNEFILLNRLNKVVATICVG